jgi:hypothetical protein
VTILVSAPPVGGRGILHCAAPRPCVCEVEDAVQICRLCLRPVPVHLSVESRPSDIHSSMPD